MRNLDIKLKTMRRKKVSNSFEIWPEYSWSNSENFTEACCSGESLGDLIAYCQKKERKRKRTSFLSSTIQE